MHEACVFRPIYMLTFTNYHLSMYLYIHYLHVFNRTVSYKITRIQTGIEYKQVVINGCVLGPREEAPTLVSIDQHRRQFTVGENVEVLCRTGSRGNKVSWERYGTNQFVEARVSDL